MQMYPENIEELLKKKYAEEQVDIDHDALWTRVYPQIKKDNKRPFVLWFVAAFLVGAMVSSLFYFNYMETDATASMEVKVEPEILSRPTKELVEMTQAKEVEINVSKTNAVASNRPAESLSETTASMTVANRAPGKTVESDVVIPVRGVSRNLTSRNSDNNNIEIFKLKEVEIANEIVLATVEEVEKVSISKRRPGFGSIFPLASSPRKLGITLKNLAKMEVPKQFIDKELVPTVSFVAKKFSMDVLFGYGLTQQRLNVLNPIDLEILETRQGNEKALDAFSFSLITSLELNSFLRVRTGVSYQMITDLSENIFRSSEVIDANGNTTSFYVEGEALVITTTTNTRYNRYHTLGVPVQLVGYKSVGAFDLELGAGLGLAYNTFNNGYIQSQEGFEYDLNIDEHELFQNKLQSTLLMDLGAIYSINDRVGWNTNVQYSYGLSGYNSGKNPISQKYNVIKINTGLRYQF